MQIMHDLLKDVYPKPVFREDLLDRVYEEFGKHDRWTQSLAALCGERANGTEPKLRWMAEEEGLYGTVERIKLPKSETLYRYRG